MRKFDKIKKQINDGDIDDFAYLIDRYNVWDDTPWVKWFDENYCQKCGPIKGKIEGSDKEMEFAPCEFGDNPCGFANCETVKIIKAWLESEVE